MIKRIFAIFLMLVLLFVLWLEFDDEVPTFNNITAATNYYVPQKQHKPEIIYQDDSVFLKKLVFYIIDDPAAPNSGLVFLQKIITGYSPYGQMKLGDFFCGGQENIAVLFPDLMTYNTLYLFGKIKGQANISVLWDDASRTDLPNVRVGFFLSVPKNKRPIRVDIFDLDQQRATQISVLNRESCTN